MTNQKVNDVDTITTFSGTDRLLVNTDTVNNILEQIEKDDFVADIISTDSNNAIEIGTDSKLKTKSTVTLQGNTFNGNSQLIQTTAAGKYPALDGSLITNISGGGGGVIEFDNKGTVTTNITLVENKITTGYWSGTNAITLPTVTDTTKQVVCILDFTTATSSQPTITNTNLKWSDKNGGKPPSSYSILSGVQNLLVFKSVWIGSLLYWEAEYTTYGGIETAFIRPNLIADGTLGGANFAISGYNYCNNSAYFAVNGTTQYTGCGTGGYLIIYNPRPLKVKSFSIQNPYEYGDNAGYITSGSIYGSNDNSNYTFITSINNSISPNQAVWAIDTSSNNTFYKYYKILVTNHTCRYGCIQELNMDATYIST